MASGLSIRPASTDEAALIADLGARTFRATYRTAVDADALAGYLETAFSPERIAAELGDPTVTFLLARLDDDPVGYAQLRAGEPPGAASRSRFRSRSRSRSVELVRIYLDESVIGTGIGAALMAACLDRAAEQGYDTIWLGVWDRNDRAREFYRAWGFRAVASQPFSLGDEVHTDIVMDRKVRDEPSGE